MKEVGRPERFSDAALLSIHHSYLAIREKFSRLLLESYLRSVSGSLRVHSPDLPLSRSSSVPAEFKMYL